MPGVLKTIRTLCREAGLFSRSTAGGVMMTFAAVLPVIVVAGGAALDFGIITSKRTNYQAIADSAALAAAKEFRLSNSTKDSVQSVAKRYAAGLLEQAKVSADIIASADATARTVTVTINDQVQTIVMHMLSSKYGKLSAKATAKVVGGAPVCAIGLDKMLPLTVALDKKAKLEAPGCTVYSNSKAPLGLLVRDQATMKASFICSAGGVSFTGLGSITPKPQMDCPVIPDPLSNRVGPTPMGCTMNNAVIKSNTTLNPETYCGGLTITNGAKVDFKPGEYIIQNGPFVVTGNAAVKGVYTGFFLTGTGARLKFDQQSSISLTAPRDGLMAGLLFFEDRSVAANQIHEIISDDAGTLLGTIYLPQGRLHVAANKPVAQNSAYTIVVARYFYLSEGPTMVLNTNYSDTDVPVPGGVGPGGSSPHLVE